MIVIIYILVWSAYIVNGSFHSDHPRSKQNFFHGGMKFHFGSYVNTLSVRSLDQYLKYLIFFSDERGDNFTDFRIVYKKQTSDKLHGNKWRVKTSSIASEDEWQRVTTNDNEWYKG